MPDFIFPSDLNKINGFNAFLTSDESSIETIEFDSRSITNPEKTLFICLKGQNVDGHSFIDELIKAGVKNFLISDDSYISEKANFFLCTDTLHGFQKVAQLIRSNFHGKVISITGSNGKTIVKEWLAQILSIKHTICKSPKSYNSQVGVAYSVSQLKNENIGIIECGISKPNEMQNLEKFVLPEIGIFTNIGDAHSSGFSSQEEKLNEKAILFTNAEKIICKTADKKLLAKTINSHKLIDWGENGVYKTSHIVKNEQTIIKIGSSKFITTLQDGASLENLTHCIITALELGLSEREIQYGVKLLKAVAMRLEIKQGFNGNLILNDSYNNDLSGLKQVLDQAKRIDHSKKRTLIISDILQTAHAESETLLAVQELIKDFSPDEVYFVGEQFISISEGKNSFTFKTTQEVISHLRNHKSTNHFYILKGARQFGFEEIVETLEQKQHLTRIEVNLSTIIDNLSFYKQKLSSETKIMVMVKAFAYGAGIVEVAKLLEIQKVDYLAVAYTDEAVILREAGITLPIMVMNPTPDDLQNLINFDLEPEVYSMDQLEFFHKASKELKLHIKLDTGMHRLGFDKNSFSELTTFLTEHKNTNIVSCLSHLAGAGEPEHDSYTAKQIALFTDMTQRIEGVLGRTTTKHILNSAGIERHTEHQFNMVRLGIGLYGFGVKSGTKLKQCLTLKTSISQIRTLTKEETVGYSRSGTLNKETKVATIPIGYADGYDRRFSKGVGSVIINNKEAFVIGNVCMDMTMVDVTNIPCKAGDEVIIYNSTHNVEQLAKRIGTISYELLTHLSERVRRLFFFE